MTNPQDEQARTLTEEQIEAWREQFRLDWETDPSGAWGTLNALCDMALSAARPTPQVDAVAPVEAFLTDSDHWAVSKTDYDCLYDVAVRVEREAASLREENERLERELTDAQYWRERHFRDAEAASQRYAENWTKWKGAESQLASERAARKKAEKDAEHYRDECDRITRRLERALEARDE